MRPNDRSVLNGSGLHIRAAIQRLSRAKCAVVLACLLQSATAAAPAEPQQVVFTIWRPGGDVIHEVLKDTPPPLPPRRSPMPGKSRRRSSRRRQSIPGVLPTWA